MVNRRLRRAVVMIAAAGALLVPGTGKTHGGADVECFGTTAPNGTGACSETFHYDEVGFVGNFIGTHAHFHQLLPEIGPTKFVTLEWLDALDRPVFTAHCQDRGLSTAEATGQHLGPSDAQNATCSNVYHRQRYAPGDQTLIITATATGDASPGDVFHGRLFMAKDDSLF
jgi:hypothetical protein